MELRVCIEKKGPNGTGYVRDKFTEDDLFEWAKRYIEERYHNTEAISVSVESITP